MDILKELEDLTVLGTLKDKLGFVTQEHIDWTARKRLTDEVGTGDTVIGVVDAVTTRALYALSALLDAEEKTEEAKAETAIEEHWEHEYRQLAQIAELFSDLSRHLFWVQAKTDLGYYDTNNIAIRKGWVVVKTGDKSGPAARLAKLLIGPSLE